MKTTDLFKSNRSAKKINESLQRTFGNKLNLESFDLPKLEDARNKIRTQLSQVRSESGFNENLENEAYTQAQWMLDALNSEIAERQEFIADPHQATLEYNTTEGHGSLEEKVQELLQRFEQNAMEIGGYGDPDIKEIIKHLENGDAESAAEVVWYAYSDQDGGEFPEKEPMIDDLQAEFEELAAGGDEDTPGYGDHEGGETDDDYAMASAGFGSDEDYGSFPESFDPLKHVKNPTKGEKDAAKDVKRGSYGDRAALLKSAENDGRLKKDKNESINTGEDMRNLREGEIQQASAIVTAKTMVDRVGRWIEELSGMENDTLLTLGDSIRDEMGQEQAKQFISACAPAIQQALQNLKDTREALSTSVRALTGEEQAIGMLGDEPTGDEFGDIAEPAAPDEMNSGEDDAFAAAEPAVGGIEGAGREQRESIERGNNLLRVLAG